MNFILGVKKVEAVRSQFGTQTPGSAGGAFQAFIKPEFLAKRILIATSIQREVFYQQLQSVAYATQGPEVELRKRRRRERFYERFLVHHEESYFRPGRNRLLRRRHHFPPTTVERLKEQFNKFYKLAIDEETQAQVYLMNLRDFPRAARLILNSKELFVPFAGLPAEAPAATAKPGKNKSKKEKRAKKTYDGIEGIFRLVEEFDPSLRIDFETFL
jgi:hypothetical protein